jgi:hypothetical protein
MQSCDVDVPVLSELRLDGKAVKLEQLLQLAPWYTSARPAAAQQGNRLSTVDCSQALLAGDAAAAEFADAEHVAGGAGSAVSSSAGSKGQQGGKQKAMSYKLLELGVKAAAVLVGQEPPIMPDRLLLWALEVGGLRGHPCLSGHSKPRHCELLVCCDPY